MSTRRRKAGSDMLEAIQHALVDMAINGGPVSSLTKWAAYAAGGLMALRTANPLRISRGYFGLFLLVSIGFQQVMSAGRIASLALSPSPAFIFSYLIGLITMAAFGYALVWMARARRQDSAWVSSLDYLWALAPASAIILLFAKTRAFTGTRQSVKRALWSIYIGIFSIMISYSLAGQIISEAGIAIRQPDVAKAIVDSQVRTHGINALIEEIVSDVKAAGGESSLRGMTLRISAPNPGVSSPDGTWAISQAAAMCADPVMRSLVEHGYEVRVTMGRDDDKQQMSASKDVCIG